MHCVERKVRLEELKGVASLWKEVNISSTLHGYAPKHFLLPQRHVTDSELVVTWKIPHGCVTLAHFLRDASTTNHTPTLAIGLAESVQVMHQAGIAHFALNSHNVLIDPQTLDVIIMGFHNALHWRCLGLAASADLRVHNIEAKLDEETLWPLQYISPEQWKRDREGPDYRADLYSLGVLLYEIASGSPPFGHLRSPQQLSLAHTELHPSPLFLQLEELKQEWATKAVAAMIHKLLEKEPSKRYCSAQSFLEDFALRERVVLPTDVDHKALTNPRERQEHLTLSIENRPRHSFGKKRSKSRLRKSSEDILTPSVSEACSVSPSVDGTADLVHELGKRGQRSFMRLPTCSVGGVNHVEKIIRAYQALTADRKSVAFFIEGGSGVGKSVLVGDCLREIQECQFASKYKGMPPVIGKAKFEQIQGSTPYSAFRPVMEQIFHQTVSIHGAQAVRESMSSHMSELMIQIITDQLIPVMGTLFPTRCPVMVLSASENRARIEDAVGRWMAAMCSLSELLPLVLVFDDLQWATESCASLLKAFMDKPDVRALFIIPHRPTQSRREYYPVHQLKKDFRDFRSVRVENITLRGLSVVETESLLASMLGFEECKLTKLATILHKRTKGNPFLLAQVVSQAYESSTIRYDSSLQCWTFQWDELEHASGIKSSEWFRLVAGDIDNLSISSRQALEVASCLDSWFTLSSLSLILEKPLYLILQELAQAIYRGMIFNRSNINSVSNFSADADMLFQFSHDRIQEGLSIGMNPERREQIHFTIGNRTRLEVDETPSKWPIMKLFCVARHLNFAHSSVLCCPESSLALLEINHLAASVASSAGGYDQALNLSRDNLKIMETLYGEEGMWIDHHSLALETYRVIMECAFLLQEFEVADNAFLVAIKHARSEEESIEFTRIRLALFNAISDYQQSTTLGLELLNTMGAHLKMGGPVEDWIAESVKLQEELKSLGGFRCFEQMSREDPPDIILFHEVACSILPSLFFVREIALFGNICILSIRKCLEKKVVTKTLSAHIAFLAFGIQGILGPSIEIVEMIRVAWKLAIEFDNPSATAHAGNGVLLCSFMDRNCDRSRMEGMEIIARRASIQVHDVSNIVLMLLTRVVALTFFVAPLPQVLQNVAFLSSEVIAHRKTDSILVFFATFSAAFLLCHGSLPTEMSDGTSLSTLDEMRSSTSPFASFAFYEMARAFYLLGYLDLALEFIGLVELTISMMSGTPPALDSVFWIAIIRLEDQTFSKQQKEVLLLNAQSKLEQYASITPLRFQCKALLIEAELNRLQGKPTEIAMKLYEQALASSLDAGLPLFGALAAERLSSFYRELGLRLCSSGMLEEAIMLYSQWGASAKCDSLKGSISKQSKGESLLTRSGNAFAEKLRQAKTLNRISQSITQGKDIRQMIRIAVEILISDVNCEEGYLLCSQDHEVFCIMRWKNSELIGFPLPKRDKNENCLRLQSLRDEIPVDVVQRICTVVGLSQHYVRRKLDEHIKKTNIATLQVLPLSSGGHLFGAFYLVSRDKADAFSNVEHILDHLVSQVAVVMEYHFLSNSLDNLLAKARKKNRELKRITEMKDYFVRAISDELKTPLSGILADLQKLQESVIDLEQTQLVEMIKTSAQGLLQVMCDIIDYQACQSNQLQIVFTTFDVRTCLDECVRPKQPNNNVQIHIETDELIRGLFIVEGDQVHLKKVLTNLCSNALKFTEKGQITLKCEVVTIYTPEEGSPEYAKLLFTVEDTGIGISEEHQKLLFQPFSQIDRSSTRQHSGTGMGLALSQRLIELLSKGESQISCRSAIGFGSSFSFPLELELCHCEPLAPPAENLSLSEASLFILSSEPKMISSLRMESERCGLSLQECHSDLELIQRFPATKGRRILLIDAQKRTPSELQELTDNLIQPNDHIFLFSNTPLECTLPKHSTFLFYPLLKNSFAIALSKLFLPNQ